MRLMKDALEDDSELSYPDLLDDLAFAETNDWVYVWEYALTIRGIDAVGETADIDHAWQTPKIEAALDLASRLLRKRMIPRCVSLIRMDSHVDGGYVVVADQLNAGSL